MISASNNMLGDGERHSHVIQIAVSIASELLEKHSRNDFVQAIVPKILERFGSNAGGVVSQHHGNWTRDYWTGDASGLPERLIGEAVDQSQVVCDSNWCVAPLPNHSQGPGIGKQSGVIAPVSAVVMKLPSAESRSAAENDQIQQITSLLGAALSRIELYQHQDRRIEQLSAVLVAAASWQRLDDDEALLHQIADTATELLGCERSSIFLWDRRRHKLVGRPALGIEGGTLEVDDDAGVVGEVLATNEPKIWNGGTDAESRVNRKVDESLEFQTRSLVAVPMSGARGDLIGVFEAINAKDVDDGSDDDLDRKFDEGDARLLADLATHAAVAIESLRTRKRLTQDRDRLVNDAASSTQLIGDHPSVTNVRKSASKVAKTDLSVLVLGRNGTGKEVLARMIHYESQRRSGPFIAVNCAALVETLLESELFGHEKGAFTDANQTRTGKFELANGGTLFLDEVGDMSPGGQAKLLRVLEDKVVVRVGGSQTIPVDVRVIAATNQPLEELIQERRFREDLFFRLNVVSLTLPPLAQRGDDVLLLAEHFLEQFSYQIGRQVPRLDQSARSALLTHPWPGNIRELRNTIERVSYLCNEDVVTEEDLMISGGSASGPGGSGGIRAFELGEATKEFQVTHILSAIDACKGNMTDAAQRLGLHRSNLYRKMRQLGMPTSGE